jgi:hypothetical protein
VHPLFLAAASDSLLSVGWQQTLWDGILGAAVGGAVSVLVTLYALRRTIKAAQHDAQTAMRRAADQHVESLEADRELARVQRELDAVAALLTYLELDYAADPDSAGHRKELTSRFNILALNSREDARRRWYRLPAQITHVQFADTNVLAWAVSMDQAIGRIVIDLPRSPVAGPFGLNSSTLVRRVALSQRLVRAQLPRLTTMLLGWPDMDDDAKVHAFDELVMWIRGRSAAFLEAIDYLEITDSVSRGKLGRDLNRLQSASRTRSTSALPSENLDKIRADIRARCAGQLRGQEELVAELASRQDDGSVSDSI